MVKITNGVNVFEVSNGAFEGIYSKQGYSKVAETIPSAPVTEPVVEKTEDELFVENVVEKPISQWSKDEVKRFAELKEVDISGTKNAGEAKELIKVYLDQSNV